MQIKLVLVVAHFVSRRMIPPGKKSLSLGSQNKSNEKVKTFKIDVLQRTPKSRLVPTHSSVHALR